MRADDLPFVVREHRHHFPDGFFARLGPAFLRTYTGTYVSGPDGRAYLAELSGAPVGFLVGVTDPAAHRRHVLRGHGVRLALRAVWGLALRPRLALHFLRTRLTRYGRKLLVRRSGPGSGVPPTEGVTAVLAHVAVAAEARSLGIGTALIDRFVADAAYRGCARVSLVTAAGPEGAGRYYERLGWRAQGESRTPDGRVLAAYFLPLRGASSGPAPRSPALPTSAPKGIPSEQPPAPALGPARVHPRDSRLRWGASRRKSSNADPR
ncbi:GNAT family N-acetyltransferase [Streptomyces mayteni]